VALYDALTEELRLPFREGGREGGRTASISPDALKNNLPSLSLARRNKYLMGEAIRAAGLRAAKQIQTSTWEEIPPFLASCRKPSLHPSLPSSLKVVLKPLSSAGSDGVFFASSEEEVREAFDTILSSSNVFGERNTSVLVQVRRDGGREGGRVGEIHFLIQSSATHHFPSLPPSLPPFPP